MNLLSPSGLEKVSPVIGLEKLGLELWCKIGIGERRQTCPLHEIYCPSLVRLPVVPEPLSSSMSPVLSSSIAWNRVDTPMHEDTKLCLVVPARERPAIDGVPVRLVLSVTPGQKQSHNNNCSLHLAKTLAHWKVGGARQKWTRDSTTVCRVPTSLDSRQILMRPRIKASTTSAKSKEVSQYLSFIMMLHVEPITIETN